MISTLFSADDQTWPLMAVLTWIATRSLKFAEVYAFADPADADHFLRVAAEGGGVPHFPGYGPAFQMLAEKIDARKLIGHGAKLRWIVSAANEQLPIDQCFTQAETPEILESCVFDPQELKNAMRGDRYRLVFQDFTFHNGDCLTPNGTGYGSPNPDGSRTRWTWKGVTFAREDVLRLWPDYACFAAWKLAKALDWKPPRDLAPESLNSLPAGQYVSVAEAVNLLAFGPDLLPIGMNAIEENTARFRAGLALLAAGRAAKISMCGQGAFRMPHFRAGGGLSPLGALWKIEAGEFADKTLVIDGGRDWIGPTIFADEFPERGQATESVSFVGVTVHRESLRRWLTDVTGKPPPKKRGPKFSFDWSAIEGEALRLLAKHGDFSAVKADWNAQARLESKLLEFCSRAFDREPSLTQIRTHIGRLLTRWRGGKN